MASESINDTADMSQLLWNNWTVLTEEGNASSPNTTNTMDYFSFRNTLSFMVIVVVVIFINLCGMVGNGIVIWLLGFRLKRNHFSVYILNLAIADFTNLSTSVLHLVNFYIHIYTFIWFAYGLTVYAYLVGLSLLMVISIERCVSVLLPIWYKYHRLTHLSTIVCAVIWVLFLIFLLMITVFSYWNKKTISIIYDVSSLPTFLVLFVCSLTLIIRVQCYSQQRKPSRVYWTILLNILAFLLLCVPRAVYKVCSWSMELSVYHSEILFFTTFLHFMNSAANPIIYFFIGRHRQWGARKPLKEVIQRALMDENEEPEKNPRQNMTNVEHQEWAPWGLGDSMEVGVCLSCKRSSVRIPVPHMVPRACQEQFLSMEPGVTPEHCRV